MAVRIISGVIGAALIVGILFLHDTIALNIAVGLIAAVMVFEVLRAGKCDKDIVPLGTALLYALSYPIILETGYTYAVSFVYAALLFAEFIFWHNELHYEKIFFTLAASVLIPHAMGTLVTINAIGGENSVMLLVMALGGAWLADTGAYFVGTFMGKKKLCPEISPKKTVEGFIGGILITGFLFILINFVYSKIVGGRLSVNYFEVFILGMLMAVIGTLGDLSASILKRQCGIKDYGKIMPGHGGLMDRFDSVVFTAPFLLAFLSVFDVYFYK